MNFGKCLYQARTKYHISQSELSRRSGVDVSFISRIEKGTRDPSLGTMYQLIRALPMAVDDRADFLVGVFYPESPRKKLKTHRPEDL